MDDDSTHLWAAAGLVLPVALGCLTLAALAWTALVMRRARRLRNDDPLDELSPIELGLLHSDRHALLAVMVNLRNAELITARGRARNRPTDAPAIAELDPLSRALFYRLRNSGVAPRLLIYNDGGAIAKLRRNLTDRGLLLPPLRRRLIWPMGLVILLTFACTDAGTVIAEPIGLLITLLVVQVTVLAGVCIFQPRRTLRGDRAVRQARTEYGHLNPSLHPSMRTYGNQAAAVGTALFGLALLHQFDPGLANGFAATGHLGSGGSGGGGYGSATGSSGGHGCGHGCGGGGCGGGH
ncbi:TIGR04222 domain-containing membrane protein [Gordonia sp. NPDC003424]